MLNHSITDERQIAEYANALSGAVAAPFVQALRELSDNNPDTLDRLQAILGNLYEQGKESEAVEVLHLLYDIIGIVFPDEISKFCSSAEARSCFLLELLIDIDDIVQELLSEE